MRTGESLPGRIFSCGFHPRDRGPVIIFRGNIHVTRLTPMRRTLLTIATAGFLPASGHAGLTSITIANPSFKADIASLLLRRRRS